MVKRILIFVTVFLFLAQPAFAGLIAPRKGRPTSSLTIKKDSGTAATSTLAKREKIETTTSARRTITWKSSGMPVTKWHERRYDKNKDKYLQPNEAKALLKARYRKVRSRTRPKVDTPIFEQYDFNNNGVLERAELAAINNDIS